MAKILTDNAAADIIKRVSQEMDDMGCRVLGEQIAVRYNAAPILFKALKHAGIRLNEIPHSYRDTDFGLIEKALKEGEAINGEDSQGH